MELLKRARIHLNYLIREENAPKRTLFEYMKGLLARCSEKGHWLLIDEINLAQPDCLDALTQVNVWPLLLHFVKYNLQLAMSKPMKLSITNLKSFVTFGLELI